MDGLIQINVINFSNNGIQRYLSFMDTRNIINYCNTMKTTAVVIGYLMLLWLGLSGVLFWTGVWGGIGFFGSLLTTPFSQGIAIMIMAFASLENFVGYAIYFFIMAVLIMWGSDQ